MSTTTTEDSIGPLPQAVEAPVAPDRTPRRVFLFRTLAILLAITVLLVARVVGVFYGLLLLSILVHEAGHFIAGHLCGLVLVKFRVGPIEYRRDLRIRLEPGRWVWSGRRFHWTSGCNVMVTPTASMSGMVWRYVAFALGGPFANIATGLLVIPIAQQPTGLGAAGKFFATMSLFLGIVSLIPFSSRGLGARSDGSQIWSLLFIRSRRKALLFGLTVPARWTEVCRLCCAGQFEAGRQVLRETIACAGALLEESLDADTLENLCTLRDWHEKFAAKLDEYEKTLPKATGS